MVLFENSSSLIQFALICLAFYIVWQIITKDSNQEHMDSLPPAATTSDSTIQVPTAPIQTPPTESTALTSNAPVSAPASAPVSTPAATTSQPLSISADTSHAPVGTPTTISTPAPVSAPTPVTVAPIPVVSGGPAAVTTPAATTVAQPSGTSTLADTSDLFSVEPTNLDALFGHKTLLNPSELIPKTKDAELYADLKPDPKMDQNFLQNRWSLGIDVSKPKRGYSNDLRGNVYPPITMSWIFNAPTTFPDLHRKSLAEVS